MVIFFLVIIVAAAALAAFALMPSKESASNEKKQQSESLNSHFVRSELTLKLEEQINSLNVELERFKAEHEQVRAELSLANELVSNLKDELVRIRKSDKTVEYGELEKLRNENIHLRDEVHRKGQELEKSLSDNLSLSKDVSKNQGAAAKLELLENEITEHNKEIIQQGDIIRKHEQSKELADEEIKKLEIFKQEKSDSENKIKMLESQINEYSKEIGKQNEIISQSQNQEKQIGADFKKELAKVTKENIDLLGQVKSLEKQYDELKNKLEKAEEVLRMVHGAGA